MNSKQIFTITVFFCLFIACSDSAPSSNISQAGIQNNATAIEDSGKILFETKCTACHGTDGTAGIGNAANLQISQLDSTAVIQTVTNGRRGMPSFKNSLNEDEIHKLESYVYTLRK